LHRYLRKPCRPTESTLLEVSRILKEHWLATLHSVAEKRADKHQVGYEALRLARGRIDAVRVDGLDVGAAFFGSFENFFTNVDKNLEGLAVVSAEIKEDAILPSFTLFEQRAAELSQLLASTQAIQFESNALPRAITAPSAASA
jgi:hypothetical protein